LSLSLAHRESLVGLLTAFCTHQHPELVLQHGRALTAVAAALLLDPEAPTGVAWLATYATALGSLQDARACAAATALLLGPVQQLCTRPGMEERAAATLQALVVLPRLHEAAAGAMRGPFATSLLAICGRLDAPRRLWAAAASLLAALMSASPVAVAPPPVVTRLSVDEYSALLHALTAVALRLGADAFVSPAHGTVQWLWMLDIVVPALSREPLLELGARTLKAVMLRGSGCNSSHWLVISAVLGTS
jgi:hypothetical protein